tara:strand:+ start:331 stop:843 length:513 start_codon:yes stop_codon:yes gene_type:complete
MWITFVYFIDMTNIHNKKDKKMNKNELNKYMETLVDSVQASINHTGTKLQGIEVPSSEKYRNTTQWYNMFKDDMRLLDHQAYLFGKFFSDNAQEYDLSKPEDRKFLKSDRAFLTGVGKEASKRNLIQTPQCLYRAFKAYQLGYFSVEDYEADDPFCELCSGCGRCESEVQ